ncbi:MAG: AAA family ATPase [Nannocystis sp.]|nr:AAA family ATPase [Nannocystis sp.]
MLEKVAFKGFKALADVTIELEALTVLVGANGSGKTSVLKGIDLLGQAAEEAASSDDLRERLGRIVDLQNAETRSWDQAESPSVSGRHQKLVLELLFLTAAIQLNHDDGTSHSLPSWSHLVYNNVPETLRRHLQPNSPFRREFSPCVRLQLDPARLAEPSFLDASDEFPRLRHDGQGLASLVAYFLETRSEALEQIEAGLRAVVPHMRRLRVVPTPVTRQEKEILRINNEALIREVKHTYRGHRLEVEVEGQGYVPAHELSDGTLITLGLFAALLGPQRPKILLLDDIDRGLHPAAQRVLVERLREIQKRVQIVCTSHSPYFLDALRPEEVRVMKLDRQRHAHCRRLTEHPEWESWKDSMTPGEFWSTVGEDWVFAEEE